MAFHITPHGEPLFMTSARDRRIRIWDIGHGRVLRSWRGGFRTRALALTSLPEIGDMAVAAHSMDRVSAWKLAPTDEEGEPRLLWRSSSLSVPARHGIALAEIDGRAVVVSQGQLSERVARLDLRTGERVSEGGDSGVEGGGGGTGGEGSVAGGIDFLPERIGGVKGDPTAFVVGGPDGQVRLCRGRRLVGGWTGHSGKVRAVAGLRHAGGDVFVVSGSEDGTVRLWNTAVSTVGDQSLHDESHDDTLTCSDLVALPDGRMPLATGTTDGTVRIWDGATGRPVARCSKVAAKWNYTDYMIASDGPYGGRLSSGHDVAVKELSWIPSSGGRDVTLASCDAHGHLQFWSAEGDPLIRPETMGPVSALAATAFGDGGLLAVGQPLAVVAVYADHGERLHTWTVPHGSLHRIRAVALAPQTDGTLLLAGGDKKGNITLWEHPSGTAVGQLCVPGGGSAHRGPVRSLVAVLGSDGAMLVSAGEKAVRLWNLPSRSLEAEFSCRPVLDVPAVATPDGRVLAAVPTADHAVEIWDARAGARLFSVHGFPQPVSTVSLYASGVVLLAVGHGRDVHLVELLGFADRRSPSWPPGARKTDLKSHDRRPGRMGPDPQAAGTLDKALPAILAANYAERLDAARYRLRVITGSPSDE